MRPFVSLPNPQTCFNQQTSHMRHRRLAPQQHSVCDLVKQLKGDRCSQPITMCDHSVCNHSLRRQPRCIVYHTGRACKLKGFTSKLLLYCDLQVVAYEALATMSTRPDSSHIFWIRVGGNWIYGLDSRLQAVAVGGGEAILDDCKLPFALKPKLPTSRQQAAGTPVGHGTQTAMSHLCEVLKATCNQT